jgi:hypothetical protein
MVELFLWTFLLSLVAVAVEMTSVAVAVLVEF